MRFKPDFPFRLFGPMENLNLSVFRWILDAKGSILLTPVFLKTKSPKKMNPASGDSYFKPITRDLCVGGTSK